jgi:hypothetical protein
MVLLAWSQPTGNRRAAEIHTVAGHHLLSVPTDSASPRSIYYEVCNTSGGKSAFHWKGAGFGVDAFYQLPPRLCARKEVHSDSEYDVRGEEIVFQGGKTGTIRTWVPCAILAGRLDTCKGGALGAAVRMASRLALFASRPDGDFVEMETITIQLDLQANAPRGRLLIRTSKGIEQVLVAFPSAEASVEELRRIFADSPTITIETFAYFKKVRELTPSLLARDIPDNSPVLSIGKSAGGALDQSLEFGDVAKLGLLATLLVERDRQVVARNDVAVPRTAKPK